MPTTRTIPTPADAARPATVIWHVDTAQSGASFQAESMWGLVAVSGDLGEVTGSLEWDGSEGRGRMAIAVGGLSSGIRLRDHHLRGSGFFDVANHPEIVFEATEVVADGAHVHLRGELHVRGRRHPFATTASVRRAGSGGIELQASAPLDLDELGMTRGLLRMVSATVTAEVRVVLQRLGS